MRLTVIILLLSTALYAQDPARFAEEVSLIAAKAENPCNCILFTGSSSIRLWPDLYNYFPSYPIMNNGFGGSHMSDLLHYLDELVIDHHPWQIWIYEGDNDLADGEKPAAILKEAKLVVEKIQEALPGVEIIFLSPKPSIARWELRKSYEALNHKLEKWSKTMPGVQFVDVWSPMIDRKGHLRENLFVEDGLHMNAEGYAVWGEVIEPYLGN